MDFEGLWRSIELVASNFYAMWRHPRRLVTILDFVDLSWLRISPIFALEVLAIVARTEFEPQSEPWPGLSPGLA